MEFGDDFLKKRLKYLSVILSCGMLISLFGCGKDSDEDSKVKNIAKKDYDIFIYNSDTNIGVAFRKMCDEYTARTGIIIRTVTPTEEENNFENLQSYLKGDYPPDIFTVSNLSDLQKLKENSQVWDFSNATQESFKEVVNGIPKDLRLGANTTDSFGLPYTVEGFGFVVDPKMIASLFGGDKYRLVLNDLRECSYEEFTSFADSLKFYIDSNGISEFTLNNNSYTFVSNKGDLSKKLNGVFSFAAGVPKYTGNYLFNIALASIFPSPAAANIADGSQIDDLKDPFIKFTEALDFITLRMSGNNGPLGRGTELVSNSQNSVSQSMKNFVNGKALFLIASTEDYSNLSMFDISVAKRSVFIPIKMPFISENIKSSDSISKNINKSITAYVPNYYCVNSRSSEKEKKDAQDFLTWVQTSELAKKYIVSDFGFTPYDIKESSVIDNALSRSLVEYITENRYLPPVSQGAPSPWNNILGKYIIEQFLNKGVWSYEDYEKISNYGILKWKEYKGQ